SHGWRSWDSVSRSNAWDEQSPRRCWLTRGGSDGNQHIHPPADGKRRSAHLCVSMRDQYGCHPWTTSGGSRREPGRGPGSESAAEGSQRYHGDVGHQGGGHGQTARTLSGGRFSGDAWQYGRFSIGAACELERKVLLSGHRWFRWHVHEHEQRDLTWLRVGHD